MSDHIINMLSDTVTRPTPAMLQAMVEAEVGDDMTGEDPTVNRLEKMVANMFGKEAAVYSCSGTQSNQMAVRTHCQLGEELLIHEKSHICNYEAGAAAALSGVTCRTFAGPNGFLSVETLRGQIRGDDQHLPPTRVVCLENTTNSGGGYAYKLEQIAEISHWAHENGLKVHVDGARLFNALAVESYSAEELGQLVDTISICFSKGLGCPMGAILVGSQAEIARARRARKMFGGALRQAGVVAASAIYALENHVERLKDDHENARLFAQAISAIDGIHIDPESVQTNLVFFEVDAELGFASQLAAALAEQGVRVGVAGGQRLRACTHLDVSRDDTLRVAKLIGESVEQGISHMPGSASGPYARG